MNRQRTTIKDIAKELGLSVATVSRAMTGSWEVSKSTMALVRETAEKMGYHPNSQARGLVTKRSRIIGMIAPEMSTSTFFAKIAAGIQNVLLEKGYQLVITQSNESPEEERRLLLMLSSLGVDGIIISTATQSDFNLDIFTQMRVEGLPLVFVSRVCDGVRYPKIVVNDRNASFQLVNHLFGEGCRRIAFVAGPEGIVSCSQRELGYADALRSHSLPVDKRLLVRGGLTVEDGCAAVLSLLDTGMPFDGVFAVNDNVAFGVMKALHENGLSVPSDIAVAGFSNSFASTIVEPQLTTVVQPLETMGEEAASMILHQLDGFEPSDKTTVLDGRLIVRSSSRRLSGNNRQKTY